MSELETTIRAARSATTPADAISELLPLSGIDVPIASAFLYFMDPEQFVVMDEPSWQLLKAAGEIDSMWPDPVTSVDYANYLESCRLLATRTGVELHDIHRALWHCGQSDH